MRNGYKFLCTFTSSLQACRLLTEHIQVEESLCRTLNIRCTNHVRAVVVAGYVSHDDRWAVQLDSSTIRQDEAILGPKVVYLIGVPGGRKAALEFDFTLHYVEGSTLIAGQELRFVCHGNEVREDKRRLETNDESGCEAGGQSCALLNQVPFDKVTYKVLGS